MRHHLNILLHFFLKNKEYFLFPFIGTLIVVVVLIVVGEIVTPGVVIYSF